MQPVEFMTSMLTTSLRGLAGISAEPAAVTPKRLLQLYDIEGCPYCRLVREALTELNLDAEIYPCPKNGVRFRPEVARRGGKQQFPYLVDPNTGVALYESLDIIAYLYQTYGGRELPAKWRRGDWQKLGSMIAGLPRAGRGMFRKRARPRSAAPAPDRQLPELYSFEASPFARRVRETLCELEVAYVLRNCGRNRLLEWVPPALRELARLPCDSVLANRRALNEREGRVSIPYLYDPDNGRSLFESDAIIRYLRQRYGR